LRHEKKLSEIITIKKYILKNWTLNTFRLDNVMKGYHEQVLEKEN